MVKSRVELRARYIILLGFESTFRSLDFKIVLCLRSLFACRRIKACCIPTNASKLPKHTPHAVQS
jgi:hypothetical protein